MKCLELKFGFSASRPRERESLGFEEFLAVAIISLGIPLAILLICLDEKFYKLFVFCALVFIIYILLEGDGRVREKV